LTNVHENKFSQAEQKPHTIQFLDTWDKIKNSSLETTEGWSHKKKLISHKASLPVRSKYNHMCCLENRRKNSGRFNRRRSKEKGRWEWLNQGVFKLRNGCNDQKHEGKFKRQDWGFGGEQHLERAMPQTMNCRIDRGMRFFENLTVRLILRKFCTKQLDSLMRINLAQTNPMKMIFKTFLNESLRDKISKYSKAGLWNSV
jgi:hypothetical protein